MDAYFVAYGSDEGEGEATAWDEAGAGELDVAVGVADGS